METVFAPRMRRLAIALALVCALGFLSTPVAAQSWTLSAVAGGGGLTAEKAESETTVLVVWASWSPRCRDIVDRVNSIEETWGSKANVVAVNFQEDPSEVTGFLQGKGLTVSSLLDADGSFSKENGISFLPGLVVFHGGKLQYKGRLPDDTQRLLSDLIR